MENKELLLSALYTQVCIYQSINILEGIGLIVEPDSKESNSLPNHLYSALTSNSKIIYELMGITTDTARYEAFDSAINEYSKQCSCVTLENVRKHFFETKYGKVRYDFMDGIEPVSIDAWFTDDDNEEGQVIANIDQKTKQVTYLDNDASYDPYAQEIIQKVLQQL